jgi:hypothetical protein
VIEIFPAGYRASLEIRIPAGESSAQWGRTKAVFRGIPLVTLMFVLLGRGAGATQDGVQLTVVVFNDAKAPEHIVEQAEETAGRIYRRAGVEILWRNHAGVAGDSTYFFVRIVRSSTTLPGEDFGVAFIGSDGLGIQADVFYSGIRRVAPDSSVSEADILGHVIAHELGHLLLGLGSHSDTGIMQPHWTPIQLRRLPMGALAFDKRQSETIRTRLNGPYAALRRGTTGLPTNAATKGSLPPP